MAIGIYKITNQINGKVYIGQSTNIKERWKRHRKDGWSLNDNTYNFPLYRAIRKYGLDNFLFEIIEECKVDELDEKEIYWINYYQATNSDFGYNQVEGGARRTPSNAKLTENQVIEIKDRLEKGETQESIAKDYSVTRSVISYINLGKQYVHDDWIYPLHNNFIKKEKKKCVDCGAELSTQNNIRCVSCYQKYIHKDVSHIPVNRDELKQLIRTETFVAIGKRYNKTDNAVRKWCKKFNLPYRKIDINSYSDEEWENI